MKTIVIILIFAPLFSLGQVGFSTSFDSIIVQSIKTGEKVLITDSHDTSFLLTYVKPKNENLRLLKSIKFQDMYFGFEHGGGIDSMFTFQDSTILCAMGNQRNCYTDYLIHNSDTSILDTTKYYFLIDPEKNKRTQFSFNKNHWSQYCAKFIYNESKLIGYFKTDCNRIDTIQIEKLHGLHLFSSDYERVLWFKKEKIVSISSWDDSQYEIVYFSRKKRIKKIELLLFYDEGSPHIESLKELKRSKRGANYHFRYKIKYEST